jgi:hypothetical protein
MGEKGLPRGWSGEALVQFVSMTIATHREERWGTPEVREAVVLIVILDWDFGVAAKVARTKGGRLLTFGDAPV